MKSYRPARVAEVIREVAAETILFKMQDPRIRGVTVTRVEVPSDLQSAKIYVSIMGTAAEVEQCLQGLNRSSGFIQRQLADRLKLRYTPALSFHVDVGLKNSQAVSRILQQEGLSPSTEAVEETNQAMDEPMEGTKQTPA
ncbi:MAG TPA: 30S ribosome-binding factor RbfA, partial [Gemmatales bacterium]|nr:30S ribosome-binding factor RbfA [Gemmatales bacterium]